MAFVISMPLASRPATSFTPLPSRRLYFSPTTVPNYNPLQSNPTMTPFNPALPSSPLTSPHQRSVSTPRSSLSSPPPSFDQPTSFAGNLPENLNPLSAAALSSPSSPSSFAPPQEPLAEGWCFGPQSVEQALRDIAAGKFIVVVDDENRENEGDLIIAADCVTTESLAFMVRYTSGVVCCAMEGDHLDRLALSQMVPNNTDPKNTAFTITCDLKNGVTTGISASDRAKTLRALADPDAVAEDFSRPGHIFPLRYREGGVLKRAGHTEASVDFARLAGCAPVGVLSEIISDRDGSTSRLPELREFAKEHSLTLTSIADLVMYRRKREKLVQRMSNVPARLPTRYGVFDVYAYRSMIDDIEHVALVMGEDKKKTTSGEVYENESDAADDYDIHSNSNGNDNGHTFGNASQGQTKEMVSPMFEDPVLVRVHSECCTGDVFGSLRCDCGPQLDFALREIANTGRGILVYLRGQEGRGIGLGHKMRAYALQDKGRDTVEANEDLGLPVDSREYGIGAQILADLDATELLLMTNNPAKYSGLSGYGLKIVDRVPVQISPNPENLNYLKTKKHKMGHWLNIPPMDDVGEPSKSDS